MTTESTSKCLAFLVVTINIEKIPGDHIVLDFTLLDKILLDLITESLELVFLPASLTCKTSLLSFKLLFNHSLFSLEDHILLLLLAALNSISVSVETLKPAIMDYLLHVLINGEVILEETSHLLDEPRKDGLVKGFGGWVRQNSLCLHHLQNTVLQAN